jgi:small subunit ribosomal protein S6e
VKLVFGDEKGNSFQKELDESASAQLYGKAIGDAFDGGIAGLPGYELQVTGGSNRQGTPMRASMQGQRKARILTGPGVGVRKLKPGEKIKKTIAGNTLSPETAQVNAKIVKPGPKALKELGFASKKEAEEAAKQEAESPKEEAKAEPVKEEPAKEEKAPEKEEEAKPEPEKKGEVTEEAPKEEKAEPEAAKEEAPKKEAE